MPGAGDATAQHTQYRIWDLIASIPRDNNGPIDGAAFPITLVIDTRDCFSATDGEFM